MAKQKFKSIDYHPEHGYDYADDLGSFHDSTKLGICEKVRKHFVATGRMPPGDPFLHVMNYMCPRLPDGTCTEPSRFKFTTIEQIKVNTRKFFGQPMATFDDIEARLLICQSCDKHRRDYCPGCTGFGRWIEAGFGGRRSALAIDEVCGICSVDETMVAAAATPKAVVAIGQEAPDVCWRK